MTLNIKYKSLTLEEIESIAELWEKLRIHHMRKSIHFKRDFHNLTFEERIERIKKTVLKNGEIKLVVARDLGARKNVGYIIGSIDEEKKGKVDSLFVLKEYRGEYIGDKLLRRILQWFENEEIEDIKIGVAAGNEEVLDFYKKYDFYPAVTFLKRRNLNNINDNS
ncbi:MAG: GNAT family N-acetyltransferase [Kosmotoga sp.]|nr:MAG: GNAT family N-acetyltransferase [Kosmotoga sp.]